MLSKKQIKKLAEKIRSMPKGSVKRYYAKLLMDTIRYRLENYALERYQPYPHQKKIHTDTSKIRGLYGANRVGKTFLGIKEVCTHATGYYPSWWPGVNRLEPPVQIWCVIESFKKSTSAGGSTESGSTHGDQIEQNIDPEIDRYPTRQKKRYVLKNGSIIHMKTYGQGRTSFESESIPFIYFDEECPEEIYKAGLARTIDCNGRILITLTPVEGAEWFHKLIRRDKNGDEDVFVLNEDIYANESLSDDEIDKVKRQYDGRDRRIRIDGAFMPSSGSMVFGPQKVNTMQEEAVEPEKQVIVPDIEDPDILPVDQDDPSIYTTPLHVWEKPEKDAEYIIGCDPGGTAKTSSRSGVHVLKRSNEMIVAEVAAKPTQLQLARSLYILGKWYNGALINVEINKGKAVVEYLNEQQYPALYKDTDPIRAGKISTKYGFQMTRTNRDRVISNLKDRLENDHLSVLSERTIKELGAFVKTDSGKKKAQYGTKDDLVISLGLTVHAHLKTSINVGTNNETAFISESQEEPNETTGEISPDQIGPEGVQYPAETL